MLARPRRALLRCVRYVQEDLKEIVLPSSIPDNSNASDQQLARLSAQDVLRVRRLTVRRGLCQ